MARWEQDFSHANERSQREAVIQHLAQKLGPPIFNMWFADGDAIRIRDGFVTIVGESDFSVKRLANKFGSDIDIAVRHCCAPQTEIRYVVQSEERLSTHDNASTKSEAVTENKTVVHEKPRSDSGESVLKIHKSETECKRNGTHSDIFNVSREITQPNGLRNNGRQNNGRRNVSPVSDHAVRRQSGTESFWFGEANQLAQSSVQQMFQQFGRFSPLFIYGPSGCGKSHLLESIAVDARRKLNLRRCVFMSAEQFTTSFIQALRGTGLPTFRRKYRDLDLLAIDDVHFFCGKNATLNEFQFTIDILSRAGKQIVLSSDRTPKEMNHLGAELTGRLTGGLPCPLEYPDEEGRCKIVERMCKQRMVEMPRPVVELLARNLARDVRRLSGAVNRLHAVAMATGGGMTIDMALQVLADLFSIAQGGTSLNKIEKAVCEFCGVNAAELRSSSRKKRLSTARMLAMYLARQHTNSAFSEIGDYFGGRSHSTVIAAQKKVGGWLEVNSAIDLPVAVYSAKEAVARLEANLRIG